MTLDEHTTPERYARTVASLRNAWENKVPSPIPPMLTIMFQENTRRSVD